MHTVYTPVGCKLTVIAHDVWAASMSCGCMLGLEHLQQLLVMIACCSCQEPL